MRREDLLLSCWIIEAARSSVLTAFGHNDAGVRAAERARILAAECVQRGVGLAPRLASDHARWMANVAGDPHETGPLGWFFLQRLGMYVDGHAASELNPAARGRFEELGAADAKAVANALLASAEPTSAASGEARLGVPHEIAEWPACAPAVASGEPIAKFGIIGDPHVGLEISNRLLAAALSDLNRDGVAFSVAIGDLTQNGSLDFFEQAREIFEASLSPVVLTLGNHDMWGGTTETARGHMHFQSVFDRPPFAVHEKNGVRVIVLDSSDPTLSPFPPFDLMGGSFTDQPNESVPGGRLSEEVCDWMSGLGPAGPTFILLHHPPHPYMGFPPIIFGLDEDATHRLADLAKRTSALAIFCGHTHRSALYELEGVPVIEVPSVKEWPFGYGIVEVTDEAWSFNLRPITDSSMADADAGGAGLIFRRYSRGPDEARAFAGPRGGLGG